MGRSAAMRGTHQVRMFCLVALAGLLALPTQADPIRYIVKLKAGSSANEPVSRLVRSSNVMALFSELGQGASGAAQRALPYRHLGIVVVEGDSFELNSVLKDHPLVDYFERDVRWTVNDVAADSAPSSQATSPWMRDVLGLNETSPDPNFLSSGAETVVAVIDTGTTLNHPYVHPALAINAREANGADGVDDDGNGYVDDTLGANVLQRSGNANDSGTDHGTHVAGLVKSIRDQALSTVPEAAGVRILPVRFISGSGVGSTSAAIDALEYAASRGAKVINASWGARGDDGFSRALFDSMVDLYNRDVFFAIAAGNAEGGIPNNNDSVPYYPANFGIPGALIVASMTPVYSAGGVWSDYYLSPFSNYGKNSVDIAAPGDYRDEAGGVGLWSANANYSSEDDLYIRKRGTSMATPLVAGIAGVVRAINPSLTNYEVKQLIASTGTTSVKFARVRSSAMVNAAAAFRSARTAVSHGERPPVPALNVATASAVAKDSKHKAGICGTIQGSQDEGPFGGNSLVLFSGLYLLQRLLKNRASHRRVRA